MKKEISEKKKILLAEDDSSLRRYIEIVLQKAGYEVLTAEDGLSAMKIILSNELNLIIADDLMPYLTGNELYRAISQNSLKKDIPFILISGKPSLENSGVKHTLVKGDNFQEKLLELLSRIFVSKK
ncbi:MAG: response regulator [Pyrinomonadaceae bacterium]|jgi:two-component system chemotaxis sensor kinase CheA|nr:response regulator [Pyrinomonadaceae bacterium]